MTSAGREDRSEAEGEAPDEDLVRRARRGEEAAFRLLMERRTPELTARVRRKLPALLRRKISESDVIQGAFLTAHQKLSEFEDRGDGSFGAWLDQIVAFKIRELLRHYRGTAKRGVDREITQGRRPATRNVVGREASPSAHAIAGELEEKVREGMEALPEHYREVLRLVQEEGLALAEVGRRMDRSAKAIAKLYARALARLTELVFGEQEGE
jgi:RNA polymerase sigma-70 factor (ECF subfamily)